MRQQYVNGQVHAIAGVTRQHSDIVINAGARRWSAARGGSCRVHQGDVKRRVGSTGFVQVATPSVTMALHDGDEGVELPSPEARACWRRLREEAVSYG